MSGDLPSDEDIYVCEHTLLEQTDGVEHYRAGCGPYFYFFDVEGSDSFQFCPYCGSGMIGDAE